MLTLITTVPKPFFNNLWNTILPIDLIITWTILEPYVKYPQTIIEFCLSNKSYTTNREIK